MATKKSKPFKPSQAAENAFARSLKKVARHAGHIVEAHVDGHKIRGSAEMIEALKAYSKLVDPWARRQAAKMLEGVSKKNHRAFSAQSKKIGRELRATVAQTEIGEKAAAMMHEQVDLIKSIPIRAGERAQRLALEAVYNGTRASEVAEELRRSGKVSESDAIRIARTEVAKANAAITETRAKNAGAKGYIWRTIVDGAERTAHAEMNGEPVLYSKEPELSDGTIGHAGTFPNCRCYQDPIFDD